ncbi:PorV/PorQ family protein [Mangrovimonas xylaniphaga]|uniref:hypothetical protein n=1 Tax=Mangrovimonas xylaniphaga TaxID=1645915 RepID=UPI0012F88F57|nr:hypothetical protein [Mangrovimonas xylaniphaga]
MMLKIKTYKLYGAFLLVFLASMSLYSQSATSNGSPYSLYGLGYYNPNSIGLAPSMSQSGLAWNNPYFINDLNPATLSGLYSDIFILDAGVNVSINELSNSGNSKTFLQSNLSHFALATKLNKKSGISLSLLPATSVGYSFISEPLAVEGANEEYRNVFMGSGGINELKLSYGYQIGTNINLGITTSYLFGKIEQSRYSATSVSELAIEEDYYYNGVKLGFGGTANISKDVTFGAIVNLPTKVNAKKNIDVYKTTDGISSIVEDENDVGADNFYMPLHVGTGLTYSLKSDFLFNLDFNHKFWDATDQKDNLGTFVDQSIYSLGMQYKNSNPNKYWEYFSFRSSVKYDSGYLMIDDMRTENFEATVGVGIPLGRNFSSLNISYSRRFTSGAASSSVIQENLNTINIGLSLSDIWYQKLKYK